MNATPEPHPVTARQPGDQVAVGWDPALCTFYAVVAGDGYRLRIGCSRRQFIIPETLFRELGPHAAMREPEAQMVNALLRMDRNRFPPPAEPPRWYSEEASGRAR